MEYTDEEININKHLDFKDTYTFSSLVGEDTFESFSPK